MNYLIIAAHPDDEILGCGGSMASWSKLGHNVHVLIMAEGSTSRNDKRDRKRLTGQCKRVYKTMETGRWLTLDDIAAEAKAPQASVSAQIRHLRKPKFGSHIIDKRHNNNGLFEYRLRPREER